MELHQDRAVSENRSQLLLFGVRGITPYSQRNPPANTVQGIITVRYLQSVVTASDNQRRRVRYQTIPYRTHPHGPFLPPLARGLSVSAIILALPLSLSLTLSSHSLLSLYYYQLPHTNSLPIQFPKKYCISVLVSLLINIASVLVFFSTPPFFLSDSYSSFAFICFAIPIMTWNCFVIPVLSPMAARFTGRTSTVQNHHFLSIATNLPSG